MEWPGLRRRINVETSLHPCPAKYIRAKLNQTVNTHAPVRAAAGQPLASFFSFYLSLTRLLSFLFIHDPSKTLSLPKTFTVDSIIVYPSGEFAATTTAIPGEQQSRGAQCSASFPTSLSLGVSRTGRVYI